jgi:hypothetical protein
MKNTKDINNICAFVFSFVFFVVKLFVYSYLKALIGSTRAAASAG